MNKCYFLAFLVLFLSFTLAAQPVSEPSELVKKITISLENLPENIAKERERLDSLRVARNAMSLSQKRIDTEFALGRAYMRRDLDSAAMYFSMAQDDSRTLDDEVNALKVHFKMLSIMPLLGVINEAVTALENVDYKSLSPELRHTYWLARAETYFACERTYPYGMYKDVYAMKTIDGVDSLLAYYEPGSPVMTYIQGSKHHLLGEQNLAVANFLEILPALKTYNFELSDFALSVIVNYYKDRPDQYLLYLNYLTDRVLNNFEVGIVRPVPVAILGEELVKIGYKKLGRKLISLAMSTRDRSYVNANERFNSAEYAHYITDETKYIHRKGVFWIIFLASLLAVTAFFLIKSYRKSKHLEENNTKLVQSLNVAKKEALRTNQNVINLAFFAMEQLSEYNVHIMRKLKTGQMKDLYDDVENGRYIHVLSDKYFESFDSTFLNSFPDFVEKLNKLLLPDKQIEQPNSDHLTPELRLAAFMRLGVTDSSRLSRALSLSLNTIYTYRNRLRGRAIDRENFEQQVTEIS